MYNTKYFHSKAADSYLSLGDPFEKSVGSNPRWKGRQFQSGAVDGYFCKFVYSGAGGSVDRLAYQDSNTYRESQPRANRKLGFGSNDASRRDEFTLDIRAQQYKELLDRENYFAAKYIREQKQRRPGVSDSLDEEVKRLSRESTPQNPRLFQTQVPNLLYDFGKETVLDEGGSVSCGLTPTCTKCARETFYCPHRVNATQADSLRRKGPLRTSSEIIGGLVKDVVKPNNGRRLQLKDFYDQNHLSVNQND